MKDKVSIIIPMYNSENTIVRCIESVIKQTYTNIEIVLVNDGSKDNSEKIIERFFSNDNFFYYKKENGGVSSTRNYGILKSTGKYIFFLDSDDTIDPGTIFDLMDNYDEHALTGVRQKYVYPTYTDEFNYKKLSYNSEDFFTGILNDENYGQVCGYLFDAERIKKNLFDTNTYYMEDTMVLIKYIKENNVSMIRYLSTDNFYNYHLDNENSITSSKKNILGKCKNFSYSLDAIGNYLGGSYLNLTNDKKTRMVESEMRFLCKKSQYREIAESIELAKYRGKSFRIKVFSWIYRKKIYCLIKTYYFFRKITRKIFKRGK